MGVPSARSVSASKPLLAAGPEQSLYLPPWGSFDQTLRDVCSFTEEKRKGGSVSDLIKR